MAEAENITVLAVMAALVEALTVVTVMAVVMVAMVAVNLGKAQAAKVREQQQEPLRQAIYTLVAVEAAAFGETVLAEPVVEQMVITVPMLIPVAAVAAAEPMTIIHQMRVMAEAASSSFVIIVKEAQNELRIDRKWNRNQYHLAVPE